MLPRRTPVYVTVAVLVMSAMWAAAGSSAHASPGSLGERAKALMETLEADRGAQAVTGAALDQARALLARAAGAPDAALAQAFQAAALQWAEVARDLRRARDAELAADGLERDVSSVQTELVRSRAAVEQAMARVGRSRQTLTELEAKAAAAPGLSAQPPRAPQPEGSQR